MLVCSFVLCNRTRDRGCSAHPVFPAPSDFRRSKADAKLRAPMRREIVKLCQKQKFLPVIARSAATKQSIHPLCCDMDCFASLAMTAASHVPQNVCSTRCSGCGGSAYSAKSG